MAKTSLDGFPCASASRAPGPDGGNSIYKTTPQALSDLLRPRILKIYLNAEQPPAFKGGEAADNVTQIVLPAPPEACRSILLEKPIWRSIITKWVRSRLVQVTQHLINYSLCGGVRSRGTDIASLVARMLENMHATCTDVRGQVLLGYRLG